MKKTYKSPPPEVLKVQLEESIAAYSLVIAGATSMPQIEKDILLEDKQQWIVD